MFEQMYSRFMFILDVEAIRSETTGALRINAVGDRGVGHGADVLREHPRRLLALSEGDKSEGSDHQQNHIFQRLITCVLNVFKSLFNVD